MERTVSVTHLVYIMSNVFRSASVSFRDVHLRHNWRCQGSSSHLRIEELGSRAKYLWREDKGEIRCDVREWA